MLEKDHGLVKHSIKYEIAQFSYSQSLQKVLFHLSPTFMNTLIIAPTLALTNEVSNYLLLLALNPSFPNYSDIDTQVNHLIEFGNCQSKAKLSQ